MDTQSDDRDLPSAGETVDGSGAEADVAVVNVDELAADGGCITEEELNRVLPPIPDWMRKPPKPKQPSLFDD